MQGRKRTFREWVAGEDAVAAIEAGFIFPILMTVLCGMIDAGSALTANLKLTNAGQIVADLLARDSVTNDEQIADAIVAGRLALSPLDTGSYGVDIVGVQYDGEDLTPTERWRETYNMDENDEILDKTAGLGLRGEGVIAVTVRYTFHPFFAGYIMNDMQMREEAFVRGRRGVFVERQ